MKPCPSTVKNEINEEGSKEVETMKTRKEGNSMQLPILPSLSHSLCASHMSSHRVHLQDRAGGKCKASLFHLLKSDFLS
jgi:hypothetical protein